MIAPTYDDVFETLKELKVAQAVVSFSGGGDSGGADSVSLYDKNGVELYDLSDSDCSVWDNPETGVTEVIGHSRSSYGNSVPEATMNAMDVLGGMLQGPMNEEYHGFNNDPYVTGEVCWNVEEGIITLCASETFTEYADSDDVDDSADDYEPEYTERVEEIDKVIYSREE